MTSSSFFTTINNLRWIILTAAILKWIGFHIWVLHSWFGMDFSLSIWDGIIANMVLLIIGMVLANAVRYAPPTARFWVALGLSLGMAIFSVWVCHEILLKIADGNEAYISFLKKAVPVRGSLNFVVIAGVTIASIFYFQWIEQEEIAKREATTLSMVREAELQKLQQQLQPHFLFNCLNSINAMIVLKPEEAKRMVQHLSEFLRTTLKRADEQWITLSEEWNYLQLYLDIEKVRFGHRLAVNTDLDDLSKQWLMPALLLQPLVENAIKHGLYGTVSNVAIEIEARVKGGMLQLQITNPFDADASHSGGNGFGLSGLRRRLYLLFARNDLLETHTWNDKFTVIIKIPAQP